MAKDRFSNQKMDRYDNVPEYTPSVKRTMVFTQEQKLFLFGIYKHHKKRLTDWELDFIKTLCNSSLYSEKQKITLTTIIRKLQ